MAQPWFRMYAKFMTDPDVEELSFEDQRHFVFVLCMKCDGLLDKDFGDPDKRERAIARRLGLQGEALANAKQRLVESRLIDAEWQPRSWDSLQFQSDQDPTRAERQARWRERRKSNALRDGKVTPLEQNRTDTEQKEASLPIAKPKPRPSKRCPQEFQVTADLMAWAEQKVPGVDVASETERFRDYEFARAHSDWAATWREWMRKAAERGVPNGNSRPSSKPRLSAVERVYAATQRQIDDAGGNAAGGVGLAVDG